MGYLYLSAALAAGLIKGWCGKTVSRDMSNFRECTFINLMRMIFCTLAGSVLAVFKIGTAQFIPSPHALAIYILAAVSMSTFCVAWMYAYRNEAYMYLSVFTMTGTIVTCILDAVIYKTAIKPTQCIGILLLLSAVFVMSVYNKGIKGKLTAKGLMILIIGSSGSAVADFSQKLYVRQIGASAEIFNFYMYAIGTVLLAVLYVILSFIKPQPRTSPLLYDRRHIVVYFAMAFFLYLNTVTKTMAAAFLTSAQIYPVLQGANLILSAVMSHILFKEKINIKGIAGIITAFAGLMLLNLL